METTHLPLAELETIAFDFLIANGCNEENAGAITRTVIGAERDGAHSHGVFRLPGYKASLNSGKVNGSANPTVEQIAPSVLRVHGDGGFVPLSLERGRQPLIDLARQQGVAVCGLIDSYHFSALWMEVEPLAEAGLCAIAMTAYKPVVAPAGSTKPLFGTNPVAFGWPRKSGPPMVFDQASSVMARGEIMIAAREGRSVPLGTGLDSKGQPTTDPQAILDGGVMLTFGGYKGSSIAMMVELLSSALIGERFSFEAEIHDNNDGGPARGGEFLMAIDPSRCGNPDGWLDHSESFFETMLALDGVRLPGDRRHANRASLRDAEVPTDLLNALRQR